MKLHFPPFPSKSTLFKVADLLSCRLFALLITVLIPLLMTACVVPNQPKLTKEQIAANWAANTKKGLEHEQLAQFVGTWNAKIELFEDPAAPPKVENAVTMFKLVQDDRFLKQKLYGEHAGASWSGYGLTGYDTVAKQFQSVWIDSMTNGMSISTGSYDANRNAIVERGTNSCPAMNKAYCQFEGIMTLPKDNQFSYQMFKVMPDGSQAPILRVTYTPHPSPEDLVAWNSSGCTKGSASKISKGQSCSKCTSGGCKSSKDCQKQGCPKMTCCKTEYQEKSASQKKSGSTCKSGCLKP
jgi:hypothetical protein